MENPSSPIDIARQALKQLALRKVPPTPDHFREVYNEIAGVKAEAAHDGLAQALKHVLQDAGKQRPKFAAAAKQVDGLAAKGDWAAIEQQLRGLMPSGQEAHWPDVVRNLVRQLEASHKGLTPSKKKEGLERVLANFGSDPDQLAQKIQALVASWGSGGQVPGLEVADAENDVASPAPISTSIVADKLAAEAGPLAQLWRDMLVKALELGLLSLLKYQPEVARQAQELLSGPRSQKRSGNCQAGRIPEVVLVHRGNVHGRAVPHA